MELIGFGPNREFRDEIELLEQRSHHLTGVVALAELIQLAEEGRDRVLDLGNGNLGVVLSLAFETGVMFQKLFAEKISQTSTGRRMEGVGLPQSIGRGHLTLQLHFRVGLPSSLGARPV